MDSPSNISPAPTRATAMPRRWNPFWQSISAARCREDVPVDVAAKPKEIRVDPRTASAAVTSKEPDANPLK